MDYIVLEDSLTNPLSMSIGGAILFILGVVLVATLELHGKLPKLLVSLGILLIVGGLVLTGLAMFKLRNEESKTDVIEASRMELISETYGIKLTEKQYRELDYPYDKPDGQPEIFGSTESAALSADLESLSTQKLTLAWTGEELRLYGGETEETMEELPRSR